MLDAPLEKAKQPAERLPVRPGRPLRQGAEGTRRLGGRQQRLSLSAGNDGRRAAPGRRLDHRPRPRQDGRRAGLDQAADASPGDGAAVGAGGVRLDRRPRRRVRRRPRLGDRLRRPRPGAAHARALAQYVPLHEAEARPRRVRGSRRRRLEGEVRRGPGRPHARRARPADRGAGRGGVPADARPPRRAAGAGRLLGEGQKDDLFRRIDRSPARRRPGLPGRDARQRPVPSRAAGNHQGAVRPRRAAGRRHGDVPAAVPEGRRPLFPRRNRRRRLPEGDGVPPALGLRLVAVPADRRVLPQERRAAGRPERPERADAADLQGRLRRPDRRREEAARRRSISR